MVENMKVAYILPDVVDHIKNTSEPCTLGFNDLDELMGYFRSGIVTIAGRPAMGKTSFILSIIEQLALKNKKVLLFSFELSKEQLVKRLLSINGEIDSARMHVGNMQSADWKKLSKSAENIANWELYINDNQSLSTADIEDYIKEHKPDYVGIDYLQLINAKSKKDRNFQIEDIMQELSRIAKDNDIIIFLLSQLSREVENRCDKRPILSDLRGSSTIEVLSDIVIFIYRPEYYGYVEDIVTNGEAEIIVAKNKFGTTGTIRMVYKPNYCKFYPAVRTDYVF